MTTCDFCLHYFAARTERQMRIRENNLASGIEAAIHPCPRCGGIAWATTREMIQPEPEGVLRRFFKRLWSPA